MAVLCEGISVIARQESIDRYLIGGWSTFVDLVPNATLCTDGQLARVGFMDPGSVQLFVDELRRQGLVFFANDSDDPLRDADVAVVDQLQGSTMPCEWLEFGRFLMGENPKDRVAMCWLFEGPRMMSGMMHVTGNASALHTPPGWVYEGSLSQKFTFVESEELDDRLALLRIEDGIKVYLDRETGREVYAGSTVSEPKLKS